MNGGIFNNPKKDMWKTRHAYEQEFRDIRGLPAQNKFPLIFPKHWWSRLTGERVRLYNVFQTLGFKTSTIVLVMELFIGTARLRN